MTWTRPLALEDVEDRDLATLHRDVREVAAAAPGVAEILEAVAVPVGEARALRQRGRTATATVRLPERLAGDPAAVIVDQREAMARSVDLRDDPSRPAAVRAVWAAVVERLALARREAKRALGIQRRRHQGAPDLAVEIAARRSAGGAEIDEGAGVLTGAAAERAAVTGSGASAGPSDAEEA